MTTMNDDDPIVAEIHAIREKMLANCGGSMEKLMEQVRANQAAQVAAGRKIITEPLRRQTETTPAPSPEPIPGRFADLAKLGRELPGAPPTLSMDH